MRAVWRGVGLIQKTPTKFILDYVADWQPRLAGDIIATSIWILPTGIVGGAQAKTDTTATIWLSGGTDGQACRRARAQTTTGGNRSGRSVR